MRSKSRSSPLRASPQPALKIRKSDRTRAVILNAALGFLWSHPFREMTVKSVMAPTGLGRSAFYPHFKDLHELMEALLDMLQDEIFVVDEPWLAGSGDPVALLNETMTGLIQVCYQQGPFVRAISDAATTDDRLGKAWQQFLGRFDDAGSARILADQEQGLIPDFDPRPVMIGLNRLNAYTIIQAFGQHPRRQPKPVREALARIWISTLYGQEFVATGSSTLVRK
jgi:AcrR family transcriptional regulator